MEEVTAPGAGSPLSGGSDAAAPENGTKKQVWKLYLSRLLTAWGDRLWYFGFGLFLFEMEKSNLALPAGYGLAMCLSNILLLAPIGSWIDQSPRLRCAQVLLIVQNVCVLLDCIMLAFYFYYYTDIHSYTWAPMVSAGVIMLCALVADLASHGSKIVLEKDWIVVIAGGDDNRLAVLNSNFRTIDLTCQTCGPILAGFLLSYTSYVVVAAVLAGWNIFSVILEYSLLVSIYRNFPELALKQVQSPTRGENWLKTKVSSSVQGWKCYMTHDVRNAGLGLAFLYMTVLGFDSITWAYSRLQCVQEWILGVLVAVSGFIGVSASLTYPFLQRRLGVERSGVIGMNLEILSLSLCVASIWLPGSAFAPFEDYSVAHWNSTNGTVDPREYWEDRCSEEVDFTSVGTMLAGIILARFGLWVSDLSINQIMQANVEADKRGVIGGVQGALNYVMEFIKFIFVLLLPNPNTFGILIILSFCFVCGAGVFMLSYAYKKRKLCCQEDTEDPLQGGGIPQKTDSSGGTRQVFDGDENNPFINEDEKNDSVGKDEQNFIGKKVDSKKETKEDQSNFKGSDS